MSDNIMRLNAEISAVANQRLKLEEVQKVVRFVHENLDRLSPPLKRDLTRRLVVGIRFGKEQIEVALNPSGL